MSPYTGTYLLIALCACLQLTLAAKFVPDEEITEFFNCLKKKDVTARFAVDLVGSLVLIPDSNRGKTTDDLTDIIGECFKNTKTKGQLEVGSSDEWVVADGYKLRNILETGTLTELRGRWREGKILRSKEPSCDSRSYNACVDSVGLMCAEQVIKSTPSYCHSAPVKYTSGAFTNPDCQNPMRLVLWQHENCESGKTRTLFIKPNLVTACQKRDIYSYWARHY